MTHAAGNQQLIEVIKAQIRKHPLRVISFRDYMDLVLYHETLGYYRNEKIKIGREGDFYTSSSVGSVMGELIASYILKESLVESPSMRKIQIVEWGGGNGRLALHILDELQKQDPAIYDNLTYIMIESSSYHSRLQRENLQSHRMKIVHMKESEWLASDPHQGVFVLANELLDAFPVHRIRRSGSSWQESHVAWNDNTSSFEEQWLPLQMDSPLSAYLEQADLTFKEGQVAEINLHASQWIRTVANAMHDGRMIIIDYGTEASELYAAHRMRGTLMCYRKHQAYDNPFIHSGEQDITAHVDFTACIEAASTAGFTRSKLQTQRDFMVEQGILEKLQNHLDLDPFSEAAKKNRAIRQLLLSDQMSELFKVLILTKDKSV
ncbi:SAM-dependent methyltransferase [Paenibacillus sp. GP183]|uniref:class I SAM-dependent methyltransferase n=1 Tax=Paenibacillus sp. GP183 TaxID=1882751 RepID=UPI00089760A3|nr:SAM-dependent methyltransferase [Paenibacillus sp. GP183]SEB41541.1 SAM-dependent methyltransferase, MidA family [Paenibacillus sp. GP183]